MENKNTVDDFFNKIDKLKFTVKLIEIQNEIRLKLKSKNHGRRFSKNVTSKN